MTTDTLNNEEAMKHDVTQTKPALMPCPFCGGAAIHIVEDGEVTCVECHANNSFEEWNQRTDPLRDAVVKAARAFYRDKTVTAIEREERLFAAVEAMQAARGE